MAKDDPEQFKERKSMLTNADIETIEQILRNHQCRFPDISPEDMTTVKMLADDFKAVKRSLIDKIVTFVLVMILVIVAFGREIKTWLGQ
jgi:hypothetical protein